MKTNNSSLRFIRKRNHQIIVLAEETNPIERVIITVTPTGHIFRKHNFNLLGIGTNISN